MTNFTIIWENKFNNYSLYYGMTAGMYSLFKGDSLVAVSSDRQQLIQNHVKK